jgi:hypothetical protein
MLGQAFWIGLVDRAIKSFAQALIVLWGADQGLSILNVNIGGALGVAGMAAVLSALTSLASAPLGESGTTSFLPGGR